MVVLNRCGVLLAPMTSISTFVFFGAGASYWYPGLRSRVDQPTQNGIPIFKLHGSINWFPDVGHEHVFEGQPCSKDLVQATVDERGHLDTQLDDAKLPVRDNLVNTLRQVDCDNIGMYPLVLGLYAPGKPAPVNSGSIECVREKCLSMIRDNPDANAVVVGVHPPEREDDEIANEVLCELGKLRGNKAFVNPNCEDKKRAEGFGFHKHHDRFGDYIKSLQPAPSKRAHD
jgi:hypothetical protein